MNNDGFISHECVPSLLVTPDAFRFGIRRSASKDPAEHVKSFINPVVLVNSSDPVAFNTGNE